MSKTTLDVPLLGNTSTGQTADAKALAHEHAVGWVAGYALGHQKGFDHGHDVGYVNAKLRAHSVLDSAPKGATVDALRKRMNAAVGKVEDE